MNVFESRRSRRLLVRLDRGEELIERIEALARRESIEAAWVRGFGTLEWVELDRHDQARRAPEPPTRYEMPCEVLTLEGNLCTVAGAPRALVHASLARRTDNGVEVLGGRVQAARVFAAELWIEVFDDLRLSRSVDAQTGLALWVRPGDSHREPVREPPAVRSSERTAPRPERAAPPVAPPSQRWAALADEEEDVEEAREPAGPVSWADVAAVSAAPSVDPLPERGPKRPGGAARPAASAQDEAEELLPQKGDWIDHRQFGVCRVDREDDDGGLVIRLPSGVRKVIKLDFMEVGRPRAEPNRRVFPVRPRKR